ncbi:MAG: hypothetical protein R6W90_08955 [Ignavibacteriaceae bacterium]
MSAADKKRKLSEEFIKELAEVSAGYISPESFEKLISLFENEISGRYVSRIVESNMLRIILGMHDKISFFNDCIIYPHYVELLVSLSASSNYLADILVRNPEYFYWIVNPSRLKEKLNEQELTESVKKLISAYKSFSAKLNMLRAVKRKETLRIGSKDIFVKTPLVEITNELSILARVLTSELFTICYEEVIKKYSIANPDRKYVLLALGKLGGNELNFSSDIDLMIFYDEDEAPLYSFNGKDKIKINKTYQEILIEAIYLFIESAASITGGGYIYRVDFRLRPDGRNSSLARTIEYYLNYYESRGEDWEKQMLIKSSFISGDNTLYDRFINYLSPFIYPSSFLISPTEQIKRLKLSIEKKLDGDGNIKLSAGGIRDIEFSVQALQLIYGGKYKSIRTPNTLQAIEKLEEAKLLTGGESDRLQTAYIFFRKIEHFLQLMNDKQTHTIPEKGETLERLISYLGFKKTSEFNAKLKELRNSVSDIYSSIMGEKPENSIKEKPAVAFDNKSRAEKDLLYLREGKGILGQRQFDKDTTESFLLIENTLLKYLRKSSNPDIILQNFARVIRAESFPSIWYKEFSNIKFFESFLMVCEFSQRAVDIFAEDEELRENFLTRKVFEKLTDKNIGRYSTKKVTFMLLVQFTLKLVTAAEVSKSLTIYFKERITQHTDSINLYKKIKSEVFIAALGSFGSGDLSFGSDVDIIFVADKLSASINIQKYFQSLFLKLKEDFKPFEIDCRLRPEGKSSWLAWDMKNYEQYLYNRARIWELQAFCKMSFVCGDKKLYNKFLDVIDKRIRIEDKTRIKKDIFDMRKKTYPQSSSIAKTINLKKGRGGITDIDFILQYLVLSEPEMFLLCSGENTTQIISKIITHNASYSGLEVLSTNFVFLKNLELLNQSMFNTLTTILPADEKKLKTLSMYLRLSSPGILQNEILKTMRSNQSFFEKYLGR